MEFEKTVIARMKMPYAVSSFVADGEPRVVCATEDRGPALIMAPPWQEAAPLVPGPGGCMSLLPDRKRPGELFAIMECFFLYQFRTGGIFRVTRGPAGWTAARVLDLPFAHRIEIVDRPDGRYLAAANLAADKADRDDWSQPGCVYAVRLSDASLPVGRLEPVLPGLHKNHGLLQARFEGRSTLLVGASEGLFAIDLEAPAGQWPARQVTKTETSEMAVIDLDGDGKDELATIEPFHGSALRVYAQGADGWEMRWEAPIDFGHCVLAARIGGRAGVMVSNRAGSRDLVLYQFTTGWRPELTVIDPGAAAANMTILRHHGEDLIFSANQAAGEIVVYRAR